MRFENLQFGSICIDGREYDYDVVVDRGAVKKRNKKASREKRAKFGHTPLTGKENIPWECRVLIVGTGLYGSLPITRGFYKSAERNGVETKVMTTPQALDLLNRGDLSETNAILHLTC